MSERDANRLLAGSVSAPAFELDDPLEQTQRMPYIERVRRSREGLTQWVSGMLTDELRR